jgi:membrane protein insertase Oxa1/YidC/SpoIIIJ
LIALYSGISKIVKDPNDLINFSYDFVKNLSWMQELATDITKFDMTLFGIVDLKNTAITGTIYWPVMIIVLLSAVVQYLTSKQVMVTDKNAKKLKDILKDAKSGKEADSSEVNAAIGSMMIYFVPFMVFFISLGIAGALSFYWFITGVITYIQQSLIFKKDYEELAETTAKIKLDNSSTAKIVTAEVIQKPKKQTPKNKKPSKSNKNKRR